MIEGKICSTCKALKSTSYFCKDNKSKDKLQSVCKSCKSITVKSAPSQTIEARRNFEKTAPRRAYKLLDYYKHKLSRNISRRMRSSLNGATKSKSWELLVDFSYEQLKEHLEELFTSGMCWDNYGEWHIDHIRPLSSFNIQSDDCVEFKECWSLSNLQPLWAADNLKKGNKFHPEKEGSKPFSSTKE